MIKARAIDSSYSWSRLAVTLMIATVGNVGMWSFIIIMPMVQAEFGVDRAAVSMPYMMTMIGFALGNLAIGRAVDRFGITPAIIIAAVTIAGGFFIASHSQSIWLLSMIHIFIGFGTAASFGPLIADISHWFERRRGIAVAITASGNYLSGAIWSDVAKWPDERQRLVRTVYVMLSVITIVALIPLALMLRPKLPKNQC